MTSTRSNLPRRSAPELLLEVLRRDRLAAGAAALFTVLAGLSIMAAWLPLPPLLARGYLPLVVPTVIFLALTRGSGALPSPRERRFWRGTGAAVLCWLAAEVVMILGLAGGSPVPPLLLRRLLFSLAFLLFVLAIEQRPDRPETGAGARSGEVVFLWSAAALFVIGLFIYFRVVPHAVQGPAALERFSWYYTAVILETYLCGRYLVYAWSAHEPWRLIYGLFATGWGLSLSADLNRLCARQFPSWPIESFPVWWLCPAFLAIVLAARLRRLPELAALGVEAKPQRWGDASLRMSVRTLAFALSFPILHILAYRFELLDPAFERTRALWVLVGLVGFGLIALGQHRISERRAQGLWLGQRAYEEQLRSSGQDLRLILEHNRAAEAARTSAKKLDLAFRACPSALAISNLEDGRFVEVNPAFEALFGFSREEAVGRSAMDLGLWTDPRDFVRLRRRLAAEGEVHQAELELRRKSGETFGAALSAAEIELEGSAHLMAIVREIDAEVERERALELRARKLCRANAAEALVVLDEHGSPSAWSRGAAHLLGWSAAEVVGRPARASFDPTGILDQLATGAKDSGNGKEVELLHRAGRQVRMVALRAAIGEARGEAAWLVVAKPRPAASKSRAPITE